MLYSVIDYVVMLKRLSILLSILCLFVADIAWAAPKPTQTVGSNIYYLRADGTAANKAAATSGASAFTAMSVATHNSETFAAGDHIRLCDTGGTYKTSIVAPSSGKDGLPIVYEAVPGQQPVIDLSMDIGAAGWNDLGGGVYQTKGYGRVLWEDGVPLHPATNTSCTDGNWFYHIGSGILQYKPTSGTPADHNIQTIWFTNGWSPYGIDIRNKSNIEISGLTLNRCGIGHAQNLASPVSLIKNIKIHNNTLNHAMWAIWGQLKSNGIEQDVEIYNNAINYCNGGISTWTTSDTTVGHTQHPLRHNIHHNTISDLYSIDSAHDWSYALLKSSMFVDHEGISFQDAVDCTVADNLIFVSDNITRQFGSGNNEYWTRGIFLYATNGSAKTSGNKILRNRIRGRYYPAIYIAGVLDPTNGGVENNIFACNVLECTNNTLKYMAFWFYTGKTNNTATGMNYWCNNTINYANGAGGEGNQAIFMRYEDPGYWTFKNNIIVAPAAVNTYSNAIGKSVFDHNLYYNTVSTPFTYYTANKTFNEWHALSADWDNIGSLVSDPKLRTTDSAITTISPTRVKSGGTPIEGVTVISGVGQLGIDGEAFDPTHPAMGAYAQPVKSR